MLKGTDSAQLLVLLADEIASFDETLYTPDKPIQPDDKVSGIASVYLRKLYAYRMQCKRNFEEARVQLNFTNRSTAEGQELLGQVRRLQDMAELVDNLFWLLANDEMHGWADEHPPGIRKDHKLVLGAMNSTPDALKEMFRKMLLGGIEGE